MNATKTVSRIEPEYKVLKAVRPAFATDRMAEIVTNWIRPMLSRNTYFVTDLKNCRFTKQSNGNMRFTATASIRTANGSATAKMVWTFDEKANKYHGKIS